ncbi:hypothetical protein [Streptomyces bohaiensis]|uniref:hypothetical protein n=1 Tax=Streptomyces bohaiensis TaxID=1431344 RepID=UPI003B7E0EE1
MRTPRSRAWRAARRISRCRTRSPTGKPATPPPNRPATGYGGADRYCEADVVTDGYLITAGPTAPKAFAREILRPPAVLPPEVLHAWFRRYADSDASVCPVVAATEARQRGRAPDSAPAAGGGRRRGGA